MKRTHSLSPQDNQPGEQNPVSMPRKRLAAGLTIPTPRITRAAAAASASSTPVSSQDLGQALQGEIEVTTMASLLERVSCGLCSADVSDESIICCQCNREYHSTTACTGLKPLTIQCLREEEDTAISYTCTSCRCAPTRVPSSAASNTQMHDTNGEWNVAVGQVLEIVKSLAANMNQLSSTVNMLLNDREKKEQPVPNSQTPPQNLEPTLAKKDLYTELWEFEERKKRVSSVIVRGTSCNSQAEFSNKFQRILNHLLNANPPITGTHCICPEKKIYRVTFADKSSRVELMAAAPSLRSSAEYKNVFISRDLTYAQRQAAATDRATKRNRASGQANNERHRPGEQSSGSANALTEPNSVPLHSTASNSDPPLPAPNGGGGSSNFQ